MNSWKYAGRPDDYHLVESGAWNVARVQSESDARLISAAPDLLDALEKMYEVYEVLAKKNHTIDDSRMFDARRAIAKAKGKE